MYLYRKAIEDLKAWQKRPNRKPLILEGARQVGKTSLLQEFGKRCFDDMLYVNLELDERAREIFNGDFNPERIIGRLSLHTSKKIDKEKTLIVIDEAQANPKSITALKYFQEMTPEYYIVLAGSLLGLSFHNGVSFPVGKVDRIQINPLTFEEFLIANDKEQLAKALTEKDFDLIAPLHEELNELLKIYMVVGGMPEVVVSYIENKTLLGIRDIQSHILKDYGSDISKHAEKTDVLKIGEIFDIMPSVLAKENKKFMFGMIKPSARAREYESALLWLIDAGIASKVNRINKVAYPLSAYLDMHSFKLFCVDIGLLGAKADLDPSNIYDEKLFEEFKGTLAEQFVFQELKASGKKPFYYSSDQSMAKIDFVLQDDSKVIPIEVKSGDNLKSASLKDLLSKNPGMEAYKLSMKPYRKNPRIINLPLHAAMTMVA